MKVKTRSLQEEKLHIHVRFIITVDGFPKVTFPLEKYSCPEKSMQVCVHHCAGVLRGVGPVLSASMVLLTQVLLCEDPLDEPRVIRRGLSTWYRWGR